MMPALPTLPEGFSLSRSTGPKFMRVCRVEVGAVNGGVAKGFSVDGLRVQFEVTKTVYKNPNHASIKIFNLLETNEHHLKKEYTELRLFAGYRGQEQLLFQGNIRFSYFYRDGLDHIAELECGDGDKDYHNTVVDRFTIGKDGNEAQVIEYMLGLMTSTKKGHIKGKNLQKSRTRGKSYSGNLRDIMDRIAKNNDAHWSIQNGKLVLVPVDDVLPEEAILVSSDTGLLGAPEVNDKGITVKVMLDPRIMPNGKLWLQNNELRGMRISDQQTGQERKMKGPKEPLRKDPDGVYKVFAVKFKGDNRAVDADSWTAECRCVGLDQPIPTKQGNPISSTPDSDLL